MFEHGVAASVDTETDERTIMGVDIAHFSEASDTKNHFLASKEVLLQDLDLATTILCDLKDKEMM